MLNIKCQQTGVLSQHYLLVLLSIYLQISRISLDNWTAIIPCRFCQHLLQTQFANNFRVSDENWRDAGFSMWKSRRESSARRFRLETPKLTHCRVRDCRAPLRRSIAEFAAASQMMLSCHERATVMDARWKSFFLHLADAIKSSQLQQLLFLDTTNLSFPEIRARNRIAIYLRF